MHPLSTSAHLRLLELFRCVTLSGNRPILQLYLSFNVAILYQCSTVMLATYRHTRADPPTSGAARLAATT